MPEIKILLLDDDPDFHEIFQDYLELAFRNRTLILHSETMIEAAVERAAVERYSTIFIDYKLGKVTGIEAIRAFSLNYVMAPIVLLTGYDDADIEEQAFAVGAIDYIKKNDIKPEMLARSIRYASEAANRRTSLFQALNQLTGALETKDLFLSNMSHEMRTPLNGISGFAQMLGMADIASNKDKVLAYSGLIQAACDRLIEMVDGLLTLQEGMNRRDDIPLSQFDLNTYIQGICRQYGAISSGRNIQFSLNLPNPSRVIITDPDTLRLALRPILDNAVKFTDSGGRVDITVSLTETLDILVVDTGCGMDAETLCLADKPFFMRDSSFSRRHQGAGIGLSVARNSLNILQGTSKIKSREGIGTEVAISIPITYGT